MFFEDRPVIETYSLGWLGWALNAISNRNKLKLNLLRDFKKQKITVKMYIKNTKIDAVTLYQRRTTINFGISGYKSDYSRNHNYNKILKSDWLSTALISALIGQFNRTVSVMPK